MFGFEDDPTLGKCVLAMVLATLHSALSALLRLGSLTAV